MKTHLDRVSSTPSNRGWKSHFSGGAAGSIVALMMLLAAVPMAMAQSINVLTYHNDVARTGQYLVETNLTPSNVNSSTFGLLWTLPVDGHVDAQPLYVSGVNIPGKGVRNVVYVVTEHDTIYAFDADSTNLFWHFSMLQSGESTAANGCSQVSPEIGITSAPVIDLAAGSNGVIFLVAMSVNGSTYYQRLHALDLTTGLDTMPAAMITGTFPGTGDNSSGGNVIFDPKQYEDRCGLLLINGVIYTSWASHCDSRPYTGWIMGYYETNLAQANVINVTPNGNEGAIWAGNTAMAEDANSNIVFMDANGSFDTTFTAGGMPASGDFGNCFIKMSTADNQLAVLDYFATYTNQLEISHDEDLGSGGAIVLPPMTDAGSVVRHLAVGAGKDDHIFVVDLSNMGKFNPATNSAVWQDYIGGISGLCFSMPAYFNGTLYYTANGDHLKAFSLQNARISGMSSESPTSVGSPGPTPIISANGNANGIVWVSQNQSPALLRAYAATNLAMEIYNSSMASGSRDNFGSGTKYVTPMVAHGKVYCGAQSTVGVFGLLNQNTVEPVQKMAYVQQPTNTLVGAVITPEVQIEAYGTNGQPDPGASITVSLNGTGTLGGTLTQVADVNGIVHFNNLTVSQPNQKTLTATAGTGSAPPTNSSTFTIFLPVAGIAFTTQPGNATAGAPFGQQPVLQTVDSNGVPTIVGLPASLIVNVVLTNGTGTLSGTTSYNLGTSGSGGTVHFTNLQISAAGTGDQLIASTAGVPSNSVPGAVIWLDANNQSSLTKDGNGGISSWANLGTRGGTLGIATDDGPWTGPTNVLNSMNGQPVARFTSASTTQNSPGNVLTNSWAALDNGTDIYFFLAMRQPANPLNNWGGFIGFGNSGAAAGKNNSSLGEDTGDSSNGFRIFRNDANTSPAYSNAGQFSTNNFSNGIGFNVSESALGAWYNKRPANGAAFVNAFYFAGSVNGGADYWADQNGNSWTNFQTSTVSYGNFNVTDFGMGAQLGIASGSPLDGPDWPMSMDIAEVLVYTNTMSVSDRSTVFGYLQSKWLTGGGGTGYSALSALFNVGSGTNPPQPSISGVSISGGLVSLTFATTPGYNYSLQVTTNLLPPSWTTVPGSSTNASGSPVTITDPNPVGPTLRFYRIVSP